VDEGEEAEYEQDDTSAMSHDCVRPSIKQPVQRGAVTSAQKNAEVPAEWSPE
jgi:hypothetical protein